MRFSSLCSRRGVLSVAALSVATIAGLAAMLLPGLEAASAQGVPSPPSTIVGSINDEAGRVAENLPVKAYVGDKECDQPGGQTAFTGDGAAQITYYYVTVLSAEQVAGCGKDGTAVRIKIGDRFATQTAKWSAGLVRVDITFGNVTPVPIPTATPTPPRTATPVGSTGDSGAAGTRTPAGAAGGAAGGSAVGSAPTQRPGTIPAGSPGAGSPYPTVPGGVISAVKDPATKSDSGGGFPIWGIVIIALGALAVAGGGVGYVMSRNRAAADDDYGDPPEGPPLA